MTPSSVVANRRPVKMKTIGGQGGTRTPDTVVAGCGIEATYPLVIRNVVSSLDRRRAKIVVTVNGRCPKACKFILIFRVPNQATKDALLYPANGLRTKPI
jgi:hypothetical protein